MPELVAAMLRLLKDNLLKSVVVALVISVGAGAAIVWTDLVQPRLDRFLMTKLNDYFSGQLDVSVARISSTVLNTGDLRIKTLEQRLDDKIKKLEEKLDHIANKRLQSLATRLFDEIDAVYPVSFQFSRETLSQMGQQKRSAEWEFFFYANPEKHRVNLVLHRRQISFRMDVTVNNRPLRIGMIQNFEDDITQHLKNNPLMISGGGREIESDEAMRYPEYTQSIRVGVRNPNFEEGAIGSMDGYIVVRRAQSE